MSNLYKPLTKIKTQVLFFALYCAFVFIPSLAGAQCDVGGGLIEHWKFDSSLVNSVSTHNALSGNNGGYVSDHNGNAFGAINLPYANSYISTTTTINTTNYSYSLWIKRTAAISSVWAAVGAGNGQGMALIVCNGTNYGLNNGSGTFTYGTAPSNLNAWHHLVYTKAGTTASLYYDGTLVATTTLVSSFGLTYLSGYPFSSVIQETVPGHYDDYRVYDHALTASEALRMYNANSSFNWGGSAYVPPSVNICSQQTVTFATNSYGTSFVWQRNGVTLTNGGNISGATSGTLVITNAGTADTGRYRIIASNSCSADTSPYTSLTYGSRGLNDKLIMYLPFNTSLTYDSSVNNLPVTNNTCTQGFGSYGGYPSSGLAVMGGVPYSFFQVSNSLVFNMTNKVSLSLWFSSSNIGNSQRLIDKQLSTPGSSSNWLLDLYQSRVRFICAGVSVSTGVLNSNTWYHAVATYDGLFMRIYINGVLAASVANTANLTNNSSPVRVGSDQLGNNKFTGNMDEVKVFGEALDTFAIRAIYGIHNTVSNTAPCVNGSVSITSGMGGSGYLYQWQKNGVDLVNGANVSGATSQTLTLSNFSAANNGGYTCNLFTPGCMAVSTLTDTIKASTSAAPTFTIQPISVTPCLGNGSGFSVAISGGTATYLWKKNGVSTGITSSVYSIPVVAVTDTGTYVCEVTTSCGLLYSNSARLTIAPATSITIQPLGAAACAGSSTTISVAAGGSGTLTYVWKKGTTVISNGGNISGANTNALTISTFSASDTGSYTVVVTGSCGSATSNPARLTITPGITISTHPASQSSCTGSSVTVSVAASGGSLTYQWKKGNNTITNATSSSYTIPAVAVSDTGSYSVVITGTCGSVTSNPANLSVISAASISQQPTAQAVCLGSPISLSVTGSGGNNTTYQWKRGTTTLTGQTAATLSIAAAAVSDSGSYTVVITGSCGTITSNPAQVTVNPIPTAAISPATVSLCAGQSATLTASGGGTYAWSNSGGSSAAASFSPSGNTTYTVTVTLNNCSATASRSVTVNALPVAAISPATAAVCAGSATTLTASGGGTYAWSNSLGTNAAVSVSPSGNTTYTVTVTLNNCSASASRSVTVNALPVIALTPTSSSICPGGNQTLTASGGSTYNWSNGLGTGNTKNVTPTGNTTYTVTGTDANNCSASTTATVVVNTATTITTGPIAQTTCVGGAVSFSVSATGTNLSYQWRKGTNNISGQTGTTYTIPSAVSGDAGNYDVVVTGTCGTATSTAVALTVTGSLQVSQQPTPVISCAGSNAILTVVANGANISYAWTHNSNPVSNSNNDTIYLNGLTAADAGNYICTMTSSCGNATSNPVSVTVKAKSYATISQTVCYGGSISFNGQTLTQSGTYMDTLVNAAGCDSILTLNFTVRPRLSSTIDQTLCSGQSLLFNGQTITTAGQYLDTLSSVSGCDSFIVMNVTMAQPTSGAFSYSTCGSFTWGSYVLTSSGVYTDTITNAAGCDSIITLTLTINQPSTAVVFDTICYGSTYSFGTQTLTDSGTYTRTIPNSANCDSVITLHLFERAPLPVTISRTDNDLSTPAIFSSYQWQESSNDISGATVPTYTATANGSYAVKVTDSLGCTATSTTIIIVNVGIKDIEAVAVKFDLYPNPASDVLLVKTDEAVNTITIYNSIGQQVLQVNNTKQISVLDLPAGSYMLKLHTNKGEAATAKFIKY
jgi:hypothetical protein